MTTQRVKGWIADTDVPGIFISDNGGPPADPRARLAGTGLDVWEVIESCGISDWDRESVFEVWPSIPREVLEAAFTYYARHTEEIDRFIAENQAYTPEWAKRELPPVDAQELARFR
jgi:uncharacterized protein (DUF433 family)